MEFEFYNLRCSAFFLIFVLICSCNKNSKKNGIDVSSIEYYILDYNNYKESPNDYDVFPLEYKASDLSEEDIIKCEEILKKRVEKFSSINPNMRIILENYARQYIGAESANGHKVAYINFFCNPKNFHNKAKYLVDVSDGGICYFNFKIDLTENRVLDFRINGNG